MTALFSPTALFPNHFVLMDCPENEPVPMDFYHLMKIWSSG